MPSRILRLIEVIFTLGRYDVILPKEFQSLVPKGAKALGSTLRSGENIEENVGERLSKALEKLGVVWIKLGQVLATRPDIVGVHHARALTKLKDRVAPFADNEAKQILAREFTDNDESKLTEKFGELGSVVASASVAQVYKITSPKGGEFAVKILRPNVEKEIARDIRALKLGAKIIEFISPKSRRLRPVALVDTIARSMELETDLRREAGAADAFAQIAAIDNFIKAPKVNWELSTKDVLTTEWVDGISLTDDRALIGQDSVKLADNITKAFLTTALEYGYFHADMHEGNLIVSNDGNICAVDFGIMGRLGKKEQRYLAEILYCFIKRDYRGAAKVHFDAGYVPSTYDIGEFGIALRAVGEPIWGKPASEVSMGRVLLQLFDVTEQFGMKLRPELVLLQKTMVQVEGVARSIDPNHDIWKSAQPIVERFMRREIGLEGIMETSKEHLTTLAQSIMKLPILIDKLEEFLEQQQKN